MPQLLCAVVLCTQKVQFGGNTVTLFWLHLFFTSVCASRHFIYNPPMGPSVQLLERCVIAGPAVCWPDSCSLTHGWAVNHFTGSRASASTEGIASWLSATVWLLYLHTWKPYSSNVGLWEMKALRSFLQGFLTLTVLNRGGLRVTYCSDPVRFTISMPILNLQWKLGIYFWQYDNKCLFWSDLY